MPKSNSTGDAGILPARIANIDLATIEQLVAIVGIGVRAICLDLAERDRRAADADLTNAYQAWKAGQGLQGVERDSDEWKQMMQATSGAYQVASEAKRHERNAQKRLSSAIRRLPAA